MWQSGSKPPTRWLCAVCVGVCGGLLASQTQAQIENPGGQGGAAGQALGHADEASVQALRQLVADQAAQLSAQNKRLAELEARQANAEAMHQAENQSQAVLDAQRQQAIDALKLRIEKDAGARGAADAPMVGTLSGPGWSLRPMGLIQFRNLWQVAKGDGNTDTSGFEVSRVRFGFKGHVIDPSWTYFIWTGNTSSGSHLLLDANITKAFDGWSVTTGQFKTPFLAEALVSETSLQAMERSVLTPLFAGGYTQGLKFSGLVGDDVRWFVSLNDGINDLNQNAAASSVEGLAITARGEWKPLGQWQDTVDWEAAYGMPWMVRLGGAVHAQHGATDTAGPEANLMQWTVDALAKRDGWSASAAWMQRHGDDPASDQSVLRGALLQSGVFVSKNVELFARYEWAGTDAANVPEVSIVTAGANWFIDGHRLKVGFDVGHAMDAIDPRFAKQGWQAGDAKQWLVRSQIHLRF